MPRVSLIVISLLLASANVYADAGACSTASLINPYSLDGGISGTGTPAKGGVSGTGSPVANGGVGGTGISVAKGGVSGTGAPLEAGGVAGTGSPVAKGGVSATGDQVAAGGVAGTGDKVEKGGGIGGTGDSLPAYALLPTDAAGNIGIMGVVTGFASICVNGEEVQYESSTPIYDNGKVARLADLAVGKTVMLTASKVDGNLHAKAIGLFNAVTGPVQGVDVARQQIKVMGQTVRVNQTIARELAAAKLGAVVRVSGYRLDNGNVVASRVDLVSDTAKANTLGMVTGIARDGFVVNGTKVSVANRQLLENVKVGSEVQVSGSWSNGALKAGHVETQPINKVVNLVDSAIMEGYVRQQGKDSLSISGTEVTAVQGDSLNKFKDKLVKIELRRNNSGKWVAEKISERKGKRLDNEIQLNDNEDSGNSNSGKDEDVSDSSDTSANSESGSTSSSSSDSSGSSGSSGSGSASGGSSSGHGSSSGGSSGGSRSGGGSTSSSGGGFGRSGGGSSGSSGGSGSGKYR